MSKICKGRMYFTRLEFPSIRCSAFSPLMRARYVQITPAKRRKYLVLRNFSLAHGENILAISIRVYNARLVTGRWTMIGWRSMLLLIIKLINWVYIKILWLFQYYFCQVFFLVQKWGHRAYFQIIVSPHLLVYSR